jgi:hypothetical protein
MTSLPTLVLRPGQVSLAELRCASAGGLRLAMDPEALQGLAAAQATVDRIVREDQVVYGINTGFGKLASTRIAGDRLAELQRNLVLSHSVGTGEALPDPVVRLVLATKAVSLARGHSGVRPALVDALLALANADVLPVIPAQGSSAKARPRCRAAWFPAARPWPPRGCSRSCSGPKKAWRCSTARRCPRRWRWWGCSEPRACSPQGCCPAR